MGMGASHTEARVAASVGKNEFAAPDFQPAPMYPPTPHPNYNHPPPTYPHHPPQPPQPPSFTPFYTPFADYVAAVVSRATRLWFGGGPFFVSARGACWSWRSARCVCLFGCPGLGARFPVFAGLRRSSVLLLRWPCGCGSLPRSFLVLLGWWLPLVCYLFGPCPGSPICLLPGASHSMFSVPDFFSSASLACRYASDSSAGCYRSASWCQMVLPPRPPKQKAALQEEIECFQKQINTLKEKRKETPHHICVKDLPEDERFEQLSTQSKHFIDTIKMIAYRAETAMANVLRTKKSCNKIA